MICPFRVERCASAIMPNAFCDRFMPCMKEQCPCYRLESESEAWCYRGYLKLPLNDSAREEYE